MGELHLDIIIDRLKREFGVECNQGRPQVSYKESISQTVQLREEYKKQTGGKGHYACIVVEIGPADPDWKGGLQFIDATKGEALPKTYLPAIEKGFINAMKNGVLMGAPMDSLKVTVLDGKYHPVDSDALSFEVCATNAFRNACVKAGPGLTEPIMALEVVTPEESMGNVIGDLNKRRGQVEGMETNHSGALRCQGCKGTRAFGRDVRLRNFTPYHHFGSCYFFNVLRASCRGIQGSRTSGC